MLRTTFNGFCFRVCLVAATALLGVTTAETANAQEQIKPRILIIFDTSGSMNFYVDSEDNNTGGDGSWDPWGTRFCCPGSGNSRLFHTKEAMRQMIFATGDIEFALMKFSQAYQSSDDIDDYFVGTAENKWYRYNQSLTSQLDALRYDVGSCDAFSSFSPSVSGSAYEWLCVEFPNENLPDNTGPLLMWMDHHEFRSDGSGIADSVEAEWSRAEAGLPEGKEQELRSNGSTPLANSMYAAEGYLETVFSNDYQVDSARAICRPYSVILLTDGGETCDGDPDAASLALNTLENSPVTKTVSIWAIGFAISSNPTALNTLNTIAQNGGTEFARSATNQAELSGVLYDIVSSSLLVEVCNQADDDCDGEIDEDFRPDKTYCNTGDTCTFPNDGQPREDADILCERPSECACDGIDNNCDGETDEPPDGETSWPVTPNACGGCDGSNPEFICGDPNEGECDRGDWVCAPGIGMQCVGEVEPTAEKCNGLDDDCDGETDEGIVGEVCGVCSDGNYYCVDGETVCCGSGTTSTDCVPLKNLSIEVCNGEDDDCDGSTDENVLRPCGGCDDVDCLDPNEGVCAEGRETCSDGDWGDCEGDIGPSDEVCDRLDNDCDGETDEDVVGESCGVCNDGNWYCVQGGEQCCAGLGTGGVCLPVQVPSDEQCNGIDDDCDGRTDEDIPPRECPESGYEDYFGKGVCNKGYEVCRDSLWGNVNPATGNWEEGYCLGLQLPTDELCNNLDDDCDSQTDEGTSGGVCGPCRDGHEECIGGILQCADATSPQPEVCNGIDDNCNELTDEGLLLGCGGCALADDTDTEVPPEYEDCLAAQEADTDVGPSEGECQEGARFCDPSADDLWGSCEGGIGPSSERCDAKDNDCDGLTDEEEEIENINQRCATAVGICEDGWWRCVEESDGGKSLACCKEIAEDGTCVAPKTPEVEECDGLDNDCDGETDEGLPNTGEPCGLEMGFCEAGTIQCVCAEEGNKESCQLECTGALSGSDEICDALDNDCDGETDEDIPLGNECTNSPGGVPAGECGMGYEECINGKFVCNANGPSDEICDGLDNDCDGETDENLAVECREGSICMEGECAPICVGQELQCPPGLTCVDITSDGGESLRICTTDVCRKGSDNALPCVENPYWCDEGSEPLCKCSQARKKCVSICDDVLCPDGRVCVPKTGQCQTITDDCYATGCPDGQVCRGGVCTEDPCPESCPDGEYCNLNGECVKPCVDIECPVRCFEGACVDLCDGVECEDGQICNDVTGECEAPGACSGVRCKFYEVCRGGNCVEDPCFSITCPNGLRCEDGTCLGIDDNKPRDTDSENSRDTDDTDSVPDGKDSENVGTDDNDTGPDNSYGMDRVLATGMGGCLCNTAPGAPPSSGSLWIFIMATLGLAARFALRKTAYARLMLLGIGLVAMLLLIGCTTEPYVFNPSAGGSDSSISSGTDSESGAKDTADVDSDDDSDSNSEGCVADDPDNNCDGIDNDCDGETDEGVDLNTSSQFCGSCDNDCREKYANAFGICQAAKCKMGNCAGSYQDLNQSDTDGCEYYCQKRSDKDRCNGVDLGDGSYKGIDDDCDGEIDEESDLQLESDKYNCGRCGNVCQAPHADMRCEEGKCVFDPVENCNENFHDLNGDPSDGCEYACEKTADDEQRCDKKDDDCDGETDEGDPESGGVCYELAGGCTVNGGDVSCPPNSHCKAGVWTCIGGGRVCSGQVGPLPIETCNGIDDNCDGQVDENLVQSCSSGGDDFKEIGVCRKGYRRCVDGQFDETVCEGEMLPSDEICDGFDNDCDGETDESDDGGPLIGKACGKCGGHEYCVGGIRQCCLAVEDDGTCVEVKPPDVETCNGFDDDCDGVTDNNMPIVLCDGDDADLCTEGIISCEDGVVGCSDTSDDNVEACDGLDNDCDGFTDDDDPGMVSAPSDMCRTACGDAFLGTECLGAAGWRCNYDCTKVECNEIDQMVQAETLCDNLDNDCDGETDENLLNSSENCGACGNSCDGTQGEHVVTMVCAAGQCRVSECEAGYHNLDGNDSCEYGPCTASGTEDETCDQIDNDCNGLTDELAASTEVCDGLDNDCDGQTDEGLTAPSICNNRCPGTGHAVMCDGVNGWRCHYNCVSEGGQVDCQNNDDLLVANNETLCDGLDNDCDGDTDEGFFLWDDRTVVKGARCTSDGVGTCSMQGWVKCSADQSEYICCKTQNGADCVSGDTIPEIPAAGVEDGSTPDGLDNDCDGMVDEGADGCIETVNITGPEGAMEIFKYEASKRTAVQKAPCAEAQAANTKPWVSISFEDARNACLRLNTNDDSCDYDDPDGNGPACWDLCLPEQWYYSCAYGTVSGENAPHLYPYGETYAKDTCNGVEHNQNMALPAGSMTQCVSTWNTTDTVADLSGNVEEWTLDARISGTDDLRVIRGGSYKSVANGLACNFDFLAADELDFQMEQLGFRCCRGAAPITSCENELAKTPNHPSDFNVTGFSDQCSTDGWWRASDVRSVQDNSSAWELGKSTQSGTNTGCLWATKLQSNYGSSHSSYLYSPAIEISACAGKNIDVQWNMSLTLGTGDTFAVERRIATYVYNSGTDSWSWVWATDGTLGYTRIGNAFTPTDNSTNWSTVYSRSLTSAVSGTGPYLLQLRFVLVADANTNAAGAFIDNVRLVEN